MRHVSLFPTSALHQEGSMSLAFGPMGDAAIPTDEFFHGRFRNGTKKRIRVWCELGGVLRLLNEVYRCPLTCDITYNGYPGINLANTSSVAKQRNAWAVNAFI